MKKDLKIRRNNLNKDFKNVKIIFKLIRKRSKLLRCLSILILNKRKIETIIYIEKWS